MTVYPTGYVPPRLVGTPPAAASGRYERAPERKNSTPEPVSPPPQTGSQAGPGSGDGPGKPGRRVHPRGGVIGQLLLVVGAWLAYSLGRSFSGSDVSAAVDRGQAILRLDDELGFGWVIDVNHWALQQGLLAVPLSMGYASLHYIVTPLVLVWLWRRHPAKYQSALFSLMVMSAIGLVIFITLPVAPPRLLPGFGWMDMLKQWSDYGWWGAGASAPRGFEHLTNQYAAVPSLHVGWAVWCAWAWHRSGGTFARRFGWLYPTGVAVTVVLTGNHYVLDVATGIVVAFVACWSTPRLMVRGQAFLTARRAPNPTPAESAELAPPAEPETVTVISVDTPSTAPQPELVSASRVSEVTEKAG